MSLIFGAIALVLAVKKGRSPLWFLAGFAFTFFGVLVVMFLPDVSRRQQATYTGPAPTRPEERTEDYVPPSIQKDDYKANSVDVGYEIVEDDNE